MVEQAGAVTFKGNPMTLAGEGRIAEGQPAPDATLLANDLSEKKLSDYLGKVAIVATVPSLDTSVCDAQTRQFNEQASALGENVAVLTVSNDTPFAQKRWCGAAGVERVETLSDFRDHELQQGWGLRVKELGVIARSVTVLDPSGNVAYHQLVQEIAEHPDYEAALGAAEQAAQG
jgi:thiol peroxidase